MKNNILWVILGDGNGDEREKGRNRVLFNARLARDVGIRQLILKNYLSSTCWPICRTGLCIIQVGRQSSYYCYRIISVVHLYSRFYTLRRQVNSCVVGWTYASFVHHYISNENLKYTSCKRVSVTSIYHKITSLRQFNGETQHWK